MTVLPLPTGPIGEFTEEKPLPYPKSVFFIVVTEFCERFSYYGMRAVLTIYMRNVLNFSEDLATTIYHVFLLLCYALPVFGGILADSYFGKYRTIFYLSSVYCIGNIVLTTASFTPLHLPIVPLSMLGLFLMAVGTGGIKPCVVALGGEQFILPNQAQRLRQFFSVFLFAVSVGSMVSTMLTPVLRRDVQCFGDETCYPLAFGVPGILMMVAIVVFISGKNLYRMKNPECNIVVQVVRCVSCALQERSKNKDQAEKKEHWLEYANGKFDRKLINDTKGLLRVLVYYLPVPMFFALYEQLGSRWTLQATRTTGYLGRGYSIKPDQMQVANAILMFIFIPFFEVAVYPLFRKCNLLRRPLQRMGVGGVLAALSFLVAGLVETQIESTYSIMPTEGEIHLNFINTLPCSVQISEREIGRNSGIYLNSTNVNMTQVEHSGQDFLKLDIEPDSNAIVRTKVQSELSVSISVHHSCALRPFGFVQPDSGLAPVKSWSGKLQLLKAGLQSILITYRNGSIGVNPLPTTENVAKSKEGNAKLRLAYISDGFPGTEVGGTKGVPGNMVRVKLVNDQGDSHSFELNSAPGPNSTSRLRTSWTFELEPNTYQMVVSANETRTDTSLIPGRIELRTGGSYVLAIHENYTNPSTLQAQLTTITEPNHVHMLWLLPQYILIAWAEVLFIISGMEFSFTEAPESMKSVLQSCWHLMNAAGNAIVIISAQLSLESKTEFFGFSALMGLDVIVFCLLAMRYKYVVPIPPPEPVSSFQEDNMDKVDESRL